MPDRSEQDFQSIAIFVLQELLILENPSDILFKYWHYSSFRGEQENIIRAVAAGKDVLALLPTGGGKSVCFQVPALMKEGLCLVISPLIALMKDQVENLQKLGIPALALHSGMTYYEVKKTLQEVLSGNCKLLYLSPERLESPLFKEYLHGLNISLLAVDEAHCVSQWGYDFRPPYLRIADIRKELPGVPVLALTASATPMVQQDIVTQLRLRQPDIYRQPFERANLSYSVFNIESKINKVTEILNNVKGSCIIYCRNRKQTKNVADLLCLQQIPADFYHAGLTRDEREYKQNAWIRNQKRVIVCTNAFGMGIDKPDVRTVIHYDTPDCLENYYQEAGRVGRDGKKAYAVLLYQAQDITDLENLSDVRFPSVPEIRKVYQSIADYLQVPVGLGQGNYYDFDLMDFAGKFKLNILLVINVLKVLEQEGHLSFAGDIFLPSQAVFTADKDSLNEVEKIHPEVDVVMKCLLRTYEGIYDNRVSINEKQMAKLIRLPYEKIYTDLRQLHTLGIIDYWPQKETPQIHFLFNRAPARSLHINMETYFERKQLYRARIKIMLKYLQTDKECRSGFISRYFGEDNSKDCGVCDNCLNRKNIGITEDEFKKIEEFITSHLSGPSTFTVKELLLQLNGIPKDHFWEVITFLQGEGKIKIDERGLVTKR